MQMQPAALDLFARDGGLSVPAVRQSEATVMGTDVTSYTELIAGINAQREALGVRMSDFDDLAGFPAGLTGKAFGMLQVKRLGPEKLFDAIRAAGLRIKLEIDPDQVDKMKQRISEHYNPRQENQARAGHASTTLSSAVLTRVFKAMGRNGGKARWHRKSKEDRSAHMRMMVMERERKRRKAKKAAHQRRLRDKRNQQPLQIEGGAGG